MRIETSTWNYEIDSLGRRRFGIAMNAPFYPPGNIAGGHTAGKGTREPLEEEALYDFAVRALGRRMRTTAELRKLMSSKVEDDEVGEKKIAIVLLRLKQQRYLDDVSFASTYTRLRQENKGFGKFRVQRELANKGISGELIASTLQAAYENSDESELARRYLARKRIAKPRDQKEAARVMRRLSAAGFSLAAITKMLRGWEVSPELDGGVEGENPAE